MKKLKSIDELRAGFPAGRGKPGWSSDTRFAAQALLFIAEQLERIEKKLATRGAFHIPPKPSKWQQFFAAGMKAGKTPAQIAAEWRAQKRVAPHESSAVAKSNRLGRLLLGGHSE